MNRDRHVKITFDDDINKYQIRRHKMLTALGGTLLCAILVLAFTGCSKTEKSKTTAKPQIKTSNHSSSSFYSSSSSSSIQCSTLPQESTGLFPGDGSDSNGTANTNILAENGVVRRDIRSNLDQSNTQTGVEMTLKIKIVDVKKYCAPAPGYSLYIWQANKDGEYSMYSNRSNDTFLRGVQISDSNGDVTFKTILPGRHQDSVALFHIEVFSDANFQSPTPILTSELIIDQNQVNHLYKDAKDYSDSVSTPDDKNKAINETSTTQLLTVTGDVKSGLTGTISIGI